MLIGGELVPSSGLGKDAVKHIDVLDASGGVEAENLLEHSEGRVYRTLSPVQCGAITTGEKSEGLSRERARVMVWPLNRLTLLLGKCVVEKYRAEAQLGGNGCKVFCRWNGNMIIFCLASSIVPEDN